MAHFAKVENGVVREVIVIGNDDCLDVNGVEKEAVGQAFIASIGLAGDWVQTSYNNNPVEGASRGKYAGIGDLWNGTEFTKPEPDDDSVA
jgi:hypothetical protein